MQRVFLHVTASSEPTDAITQLLFPYMTTSLKRETVYALYINIEGGYKAPGLSGS